MKVNTNRILGLTAFLFCFGSLASAAFTDDFEDGNLNGWNAVGPVEVVESEVSRDFFGLDQAPVGGNWYAAEGSYFASLWSTNSDGTDAASLSKTFDGVAGDELSFQYFFDFGDVAPYYDSATGFLDWSGGGTLLFEHNTTGSELGDDENVDWTPVSYALPVTGSYTLLFSTQDGPGTFESILGIDDVALISEDVGGVVVPAPSAFLLTGLGASLVGFVRRRKSK